MDRIEGLRRYLIDTDSYAAHLGIDIIEVGEDYGVATMPLGQKQRNSNNHAHGGGIFSLADMAFAAAVCATGDNYVNAQSSINYLEPGRIGPLRGEARKLRRGKRLATYEVRITDADGTLVAIATITGCTTGLPIELPEAYR